MQSTIDFDPTIFDDPAEADKGLLVKFFYKNVQNKLETQTQGRPVFKEKTYIDIRIAGQRDSQACRPATLADKNRFPRHYEAFKHRVEAPVTGTPLAEWPQISRSQIEELSFLNIKTVEQLSAASDTHMAKLHGGLSLKSASTIWLERAGESKLLAEKAALTTKVSGLEAEVAEMARTLAEMRAATLAAQPAPKPATEPVPEPEPEVSLASELDNPPPRRSRKKK